MGVSIILGRQLGRASKLVFIPIHPSIHPWMMTSRTQEEEDLMKTSSEQGVDTY